jgi:hypothetical protein
MNEQDADRVQVELLEYKQLFVNDVVRLNLVCLHHVCDHNYG